MISLRKSPGGLFRTENRDNSSLKGVVGSSPVSSLGDRRGSSPDFSHIGKEGSSLDSRDRKMKPAGMALPAGIGGTTGAISSTSSKGSTAGRRTQVINLVLVVEEEMLPLAS